MTQNITIRQPMRDLTPILSQLTQDWKAVGLIRERQVHTSLTKLEKRGVAEIKRHKTKDVITHARLIVKKD
jgi:hypothetical protein